VPCVPLDRARHACRPCVGWCIIADGVPAPGTRREATVPARYDTRKGTGSRAGCSCAGWAAERSQRALRGLAMPQRASSCPRGDSPPTVDICRSHHSGRVGARSHQTTG